MWRRFAFVSYGLDQALLEVVADSLGRVSLFIGCFTPKNPSKISFKCKPRPKHKTLIDRNTVLWVED
jgi:hypothetical protein